MKKNIHPDYQEISVTCSCGNKFKTKSACKDKKLSLDVCDQCHPFYTGKKVIVDTKGRVERFNKMYGLASATKSKKDETESASE